MAATAQSPGWLLVPARVSWHQPGLAFSQGQDSSAFSFPIPDKIVHEISWGPAAADSPVLCDEG